MARPRHRWTCLVAVLGALAVASFVPAAASADPGDVGTMGPAYAGDSDPTGEKPESKLWWADGYWWASMWDVGSSGHRIFRLDVSTQQWINTGVALDPRTKSRADVLWDGAAGKLYLASHVFTKDTGPSTSKNGRLWRYSYDAAADRYTLDAGFPVAINQAGSEALVIDKDSTGRLWAAWVQKAPDGLYKVHLTHTSGSDTSWATPFVLPVSGATVAKDDIAAVVAFSGGRIGVMWSNQSQSAIYWAERADGSAVSSWTASRTAVQGPKSADDHVNLASVEASGSRVFAAVKTSHSSSSAPGIMVLARNPSTGDWSSHVVWRVGYKQTRPIVLVDRQEGILHVFAADEGGGSVYEKTSPLAPVSFADGAGTVVIRDADKLEMNNPTSTKQTVSSATGLVVLASNTWSSTDRRYWHHYDALGGGGDDTTASSPPTAEFSASPTSGAAPLAVAFTDASTGGPTGWAWDFDGDGTVDSAAQHPSHTYASPGTYTVTLTVANASGSDSETKAGYVVVSDGGGGGGEPAGAIALAGAPITAAVSSGSTITLPSWSPAPGELILLSVAQRDESKAIAVSGNDLDWIEVANVDNVQGQGGISLWRAYVSAPVAGAITVTIGGNAAPVVVVAQRFSGVSASLPLGAIVKHAGPETDDRNMLSALTTTVGGAWVVGAGWHRTATFSLPPGEEAIQLNATAGSSGSTTRATLWYEPVPAPASVQLGAPNDLSSANDWALVLVSLNPAT